MNSPWIVHPNRDVVGGWSSLTLAPESLRIPTNLSQKNIFCCRIYRKKESYITMWLNFYFLVNDPFDTQKYKMLTSDPEM